MNKIDRALARGWSRRLPAWCGPCTFNRMSRREREDVKRGVRRVRAELPVATVNEEGAQ